VRVRPFGRRSQVRPGEIVFDGSRQVDESAVSAVDDGRWRGSQPQEAILGLSHDLKPLRSRFHDLFFCA
jgi:hypothetical protein